VVTVRTLGSLDLGLIEAIFEQQPDCPFFVKDARLRYVAVNSAMLRLCGVKDRAGMIGKTASHFFPAVAKERYELLDRQVLARGVAITDQLELVRSNRSSSTWILFARLPVRASAALVVGIVGTSRILNTDCRSTIQYTALTRVLAHIGSHFEKPLDLKRLAGMAGASASQLERNFFKVFRTTLQAYHRRMRLEAALKLLSLPRSISEIAHEVGYADHSAFTRQFRQSYGITPGQYRRGKAE
jgi:AraC-like DNA-binding protein